MDETTRRLAMLAAVADGSRRRGDVLLPAGTWRVDSAGIPVDIRRFGYGAGPAAVNEREPLDIENQIG